MVDVEKLKEVGKASVEAMLHAKELIRPGAKLLDVADSTEQFLKGKGFGLAFPINLSTNEQAAHYTPKVDDDRIFSDNDLVKIDFGAEKDGLLGDGALTVDLSGKNQALVKAANDALSAAIPMVKAGVAVKDIGSEISKVIESAGFAPVKNLGGHGIKEHDLHTEPFIPNFDNGDNTKLEEDMVIAIEPFATTGKGMVVDSDTHEIYSYVGDAQVRSTDARALLREISSKYGKEPFAARWLSNIVDSKFRLYAAIGELARAGVIEAHPTLVEVSNGLVSQAEAQLVVGKEGREIIIRA